MSIFKNHLLFLRFYLLIFREKGRKREREGEKHQCVVASHVPFHRGPGPQPRHVPWLEIEPETCSLWDNTQPTEPHQPGPLSRLILSFAHIPSILSNVVTVLGPNWKADLLSHPFLSRDRLPEPCAFLYRSGWSQGMLLLYTLAKRSYCLVCLWHVSGYQQQ